MNDEDLARHYSNRRPGFVLVSSRRVAIPMFKSNAVVLAVEEHSIDTIPLFILKSIDAGLCDLYSIAAFLGIPVELVQEEIAILHHSGHIMLRNRNSENNHLHRLTLTESGEMVLGSTLMSFPNEVEIPVIIDGLTRQIVDDAPLIKPKTLAANLLTEISVFSSHASVTIEELRDPLDVYFRTYIWPDKVKRTVIRILDIVRPQQWFRDDVLALVYKAIDNNSIEVGFCVNGKLSVIHETMFKRSEQGRQLGIFPENIETSEALFSEVFGPELFNSVVPAQDTNRMSEQVDANRENIQRIRARLEKANPKVKNKR